MSGARLLLTSESWSFGFTCLRLRYDYVIGHNVGRRPHSKSSAYGWNARTAAHTPQKYPVTNQCTVTQTLRILLDSMTMIMMPLMGDKRDENVD